MSTGEWKILVSVWWPDSISRSSFSSEPRFYAKTATPYADTDGGASRSKSSKELRDLRRTLAS